MKPREATLPFIILIAYHFIVSPEKKTQSNLNIKRNMKEKRIRWLEHEDSCIKKLGLLEVDDTY